MAFLRLYFTFLYFSEWKNFKQIDLVGLKDNVNSLYVYMRELWFELREAETLSKSVIWKWEIGQNNFVAFPIRVSAALERFFKVNQAFCNFGFS